MKKITNVVLWFVGLAGAYLVSEGLITGEELGDIQNVIGMVLGGGALSVGMVISILNAIPKQLVNAGYNKAVEKYGQANVDNFINKIDKVESTQAQLLQATERVEALLIEAKEVRENLLNVE